MYTNKTSWAILVFIAVITAWMSYYAIHSKFDYDFEKFFPKENEDTRFFEEFRNNFENDYDFLLIGIENNGGIFNPEFLQKVDNYSDSLSNLTNIRNVYSPTRLKLPIIQGPVFSYKKVVRIDDREKLIRDSTTIYETKEFVGSFFAKNAQSICLVVDTKEKLSKKASDELLFKIENLTQHYSFDKVHMAGKIKAQYVYLNRMKNEIIIFLSAAILLVIIILAILFKSIWHVIFPLLIVLISIIWQIGIMQILGKGIDVLTTLLPTILFVVGMSDVIHILSKYIDELRNGKDKIDAIKITVKEIGTATFLTSFTTSLGFFSLILSNIQPIREFGLYTSLGVMIAFILAFTVLPALLTILPVPLIVYRKKDNEFWRFYLRKWLIFTLKHPKYIFTSFIIISLISLFGAFRLKVNNFLLEDLRPNEPLKKEFLWFEQNYSGGRPIELIATVNNKSDTIFSYNIISQLLILEKGLENHFGAGFIQSPVLQLKMMNRAFHSGKNQYFKLPGNIHDHEDLISSVNKTGILKEKQMNRFYTSDYKMARFSGKMMDIGSYRVNMMEKKFKNDMDSKLDSNLVTYQLTGSSRLIDKNISYLSVNMIKGLILAFIVISILFGMLFKSFKMVIIALVPNIIPLIIIAGIMGFAGIDIKVSTSIVFTIAFGIAVDDTIHFLSRYRYELKAGKKNLYALKRTYIGTGKALILTSVILCAGFITMITSSFLSVFYIGLLISLTLLFALLSDMLLLPILLMTKKN